MTNVLVVVIAADYFAEAPEEVLVKLTKGKSEKGLKNQFLGVRVTSEKNKMKCITLNPYIFCRGMEVDKWISDYFSNSQWANFERQKIKKYTKD